MMWEFYCKDLSECFKKRPVDLEKLQEIITGVTVEGWELVTISDKVAYFKKPSSDI